MTEIEDVALVASLRIIAHEIKTNHPDCDLEQRVSTLNRAAARLGALVSERDRERKATEILLAFATDIQPLIRYMHCNRETITQFEVACAAALTLTAIHRTGATP